jgi:acyl-CoA synthetase (AMP-forming)/AMP-acid ligase II
MQFPLAPEDATMNMTPWFHRGGIHSGGPCPAFFAGARVLPLRQFDPDAVLDHVEGYGIVYLVGAPTNLKLLLDDPQAEREVFRAGWVFIGDLATWDAQKYVTIVGRKDDMIISGGESVHPVQVEEALNEHPGVQDALVTGAPDERWGELVVAYVVRRDSALTVADLERHCSGHPMLARYKRPRAYRFLDTLPLTATGKKRHFVMKAQAREDMLAGAFERV